MLHACRPLTRELPGQTTPSPSPVHVPYQHRTYHSKQHTQPGRGVLLLFRSPRDTIAMRAARLFVTLLLPLLFASICPLFCILLFLGKISPKISPLGVRSYSKRGVRSYSKRACTHLTLRAALHRLAKFSGSTAARHTGAVALLQGVRMSAMSLARHSRKRRRS